MKHIFAYLLLITLFTICCERESKNPVINDMSSVRGYKDWYINTYRCGLFVPPSYDQSKKYPLIIFLHGYSDTTSWDLNWYKEPIITNDPCIVLTPKCPKEEIYGWGDSFDPRTSPVMSKTYQMIDMVEEAFSMDADRYYIYGSSMGGYGTYGVIQKNPGMFAAGYVECGRPNIEIAPIIAAIPFWIFHGSEDPVVPVQPSRDLYQAVLDYGGTQIRYTEYPGVQHNVWDYTKDETTLSSWLLAQRRGSQHSPPDGMSNFSFEILPENKVSLHWNLPDMSITRDDNRVWYCRIFRNDEIIDEVYNNRTSYIDSSKLEPAAYVYKISAVNFFFKESTTSEIVTIILEK